MKNSAVQQSPVSLFMLLLLVAALAVVAHARADRLQPHHWAELTDLDSDKDGIPDLFDICPGMNNLGTPDRDGDGIRDACDLSPDGDGNLHIAYGERVYIMEGRGAPALTLASSAP